MILVAGPPCGGKTTYVREHAAPTDVVLDFDDIVERITGERYSQDPSAVAEAHMEWRRSLPSAHWVIWTAPRRSQRGSIRSQWNASVIVVTASMDECLRRAGQGRPAIWRPLVRRWFSDWEPSKSGREQIIDTTHGHRPT